ncbi:MATE family efflux transporter [Hahella sp. CCB-MM4]|uniref:MATE family efflux transporter n=1 Tax=Hahella sp. (strain CCB-MM4) TaxID=1926491 RepID=UPI000B9C14AA|nr:MATE family efflux transporter [Hahella sp. CCB-MM4]OZG71093.1 MATE family efflux transporter [Hahella sp. CCB-MM4]
MTHKLRSHNLWVLSWPIFIEEITGGLVFLADAWFLSRISDEVAATVGVLLPVLLLGFFIIPMFTTAGTSVASQYIGAGQQQHVIPTYMANIIVSSLLGLGMFLGGYVYAGDIGLWLGMTPDLNEYSTTYLMAISFSFLFVAIRFSYASILASQGMTHWNMATALVTNVLNVVLNAAFFQGWFGLPKLGLLGIAMATSVSFFIGALLLIWVVHVPLKIRFRFKGMGAPIRKVLRPILKIGIPSAVEPLSYTVQQIVVSMVVIQLGLVAMGANTYVLRILVMEITFAFALGAGSQILMAHFMGADNFREVNRVFWKSIACATGFALVNLLLYVGIYEQMLSLFTDNPEILELSKWMLVAGILMEPARAVNIIAGMALKGVGDARFSAVSSMIFMWAVIPFVFWVGIDFGYGMLGVWLCFTVDETVRASINLWRWSTGKWRSKGIRDRTEELVEVPAL